MLFERDPEVKPSPDKSISAYASSRDEAQSQNHQTADSSVTSKVILETAISLLNQGYRPVVLYPKGFQRKSGPAAGKEPFGLKWGIKQINDRTLLNDINYFASSGLTPGLGLCLGPGRAPGGKGLMDIEGDTPEAEESRVKLFKGEIIQTIGHISGRGIHQFLSYDWDRVSAILGNLAQFLVGKKNQPGVYKLPEFPGLEIRIGGIKEDNTTIKQLQSVIPPTPRDDGQPRVWKGIKTLAEAPESFYQFLEQIAATSGIGGSSGSSGTSGGGGGGKSPPGGGTPALRGKAQKVEEWFRTQFNTAYGRIAQAPDGDRHPEVLHQTRWIAGYLHFNIGLNENDLEKRMIKAANEATPNEPARIADNPRNIREAIANGKAEPFKLSDLPRWVQRALKARANGQELKPLQWLPNFSNGDLILKTDDKGKETEIPIACTVQEIDTALDSITPGWPKRVGETLFVWDFDNRPMFLDSSSRLFAWIDANAKIEWTRGNKYISQERYFEHKNMTAQRFDAIEVLPHWPAIPNIYYMHERVPRKPTKWGSKTSLLDQLLDRFQPSTPVDRELIRAFILTLFWGGEPGKRPIFVFTGPDEDPEMGRGVGKSYLSAILSEELVGGFFEASPNNDFHVIVTRLLSPKTRHIRVVRLDNVKSLRFSWAELEAQVTSPVVSGHEMYHGEGRRPNTLIWAVTLNGVCLGKDIAKRSVVIKINRPVFDPSWDEQTRAFIRANRLGLMGEIRFALEDNPGAFLATRFGTWERDVLSKTDDPTGCQGEIEKRQLSADIDNEERDYIADYFREELKLLKFDQEHLKIFISNRVAAEWLSRCEGRTVPLNKAPGLILKIGIPGMRKAFKDGGRKGLEWTGDKIPKERLGDTSIELPGTIITRYDAVYYRRYLR